DVTAHKCRYEYPAEVTMRSYSPSLKGHPGQIKKAADLILNAKRPMIYAGGGVVLNGASEQLTKFSHMLGAPVTLTLMGLG
ncbi:MAG: acetolactate synthase 3 large subunit, partial [Gammaproteobacteria bacterium]